MAEYFEGTKTSSILVVRQTKSACLQNVQNPDSIFTLLEYTFGIGNNISIDIQLDFGET